MLARLYSVIVPVLLALILGACGSTDTVPEDRFYRLTPVAVEPLKTPLIDDTLVIAPVVSYDVYRDRAIAYNPIDEPASLQHHHYHFWVAPPTELVHEHLIDFLRQAGVARSVSVAARGRSAAPALLNTRLTRFERALQNGGSVDFIVTLEFTMKIDGKKVLQRRYNTTTPASDDSFAATVEAAERGLAQAYGELLEDINASMGT
jgi:ABC-type uncharacterized transport system auxiliary subunit